MHLEAKPPMLGSRQNRSVEGAGVAMRLWQVAHVVAPLTLGGLLYLGARSPSLRMFRWAKGMGLTGVIRQLRSAVADWPLPDVVVFSLPDALWTYSFAVALGYVWAVERDDRERVAWLAIPAVLGPGAELGQLVGVVPGTFDVADLLMCTGAIGLAFAAVSSALKRRELTCNGNFSLES